MISRPRPSRSRPPRPQRSLDGVPASTTPDGRGPPDTFHSGRGVGPEELVGPLSDLEWKHAARRLNVAGTLPIPLAHPRIAIVGTRKPSETGEALAKSLAVELAGLGAIIVSGLAEGVDSAAHTGAIQSGGRTIAVLGTPLDRTYPRSNSELQRTIMREHLAISEFDEGGPIAPKNFVLRNRTMALVADASIIVESGEGGGSLHQGWEAIRLGRPLFIHRRMFEDPSLRWPDELARYGAMRFDRAKEVWSFVPTEPPAGARHELR
jgi:DNA processing protein